MPPTQGVTVQIDRPRKLRYTMRAVEAIERETGKNVFSGELFEAISGTDFVTIVWAGLLHEDPDIERDVVLDHVDLPNNMEGILDKVREALGVSEEDVERARKEAGLATESGAGEDPKEAPVERTA